MRKCACDCGGRFQFRGCFKPGHQPVGTSRDPSGKIKAPNTIWNPIDNAIWNPTNHAIWTSIWNPINNPINSAKLQKRAREEAEKRIALMSKFEKVSSPWLMR